MTLHDYWQRKNITGLAGIDTRKLTKLFEITALCGKLCDIRVSREEVVKQLQRLKNLIANVTTKHEYQAGRGIVLCWWITT